MNCSNSVNTFLEFFNLITDYAEPPRDLERDEDCFRLDRSRTGGGATRVGIAFHVFALPQAELRARTLKKRRHAKRSVAAVVCAVLSALGRWPRRDTGVGCCTDRQAEKAALQ